MAQRTGNSAKPDEHNVVITPVGSGKATIYFTVTDSFGKMAGGKIAAGDTTTPDTDADGYPDGTSFPVAVNHKPVPYSGDDDESTPDVNERKSLSTEKKHQGLVADFTATTAEALVDDPDTGTATAPVTEGYFSDKDGDTLLCRLMSTSGESATITITDRDEYSLAGAAGKTGTTTFRIRCFDQVGPTGSVVDFEWAEDTLTVTVDYLQSLQ